jgi:hypothetical protein
VLTPTQKGNIAEAKLAAAAIEMDIGVSRRLCEGQRYDLIFDLHPHLLRVQCKWGRGRPTTSSFGSAPAGARPTDM